MLSLVGGLARSCSRCGRLLCLRRTGRHAHRTGAPLLAFGILCVAAWAYSSATIPPPRPQGWTPSRPCAAMKRGSDYIRLYKNKKGLELQMP